MEVLALSLPLLKDGGIVVLLVLDASAVLKLGKFGCPFLVHLFLNDSSLFSVTLVDLL
jgi:hypothetical protein